jgi:uncharacterized protein
MTLPPEKFHSLLYFAALCISEGSTTATEAAVLGTPAVYLSPLWPEIGNMLELSDIYGLIFNYNDAEKATVQAINLLQQLDNKQIWEIKRQKLLSEKIDVTRFILEIITANVN